MAGIRNYFITLIASCILIAAILSVLPSGPIQRTARLTGGILLLLAAIRPLPGIDWENVLQQIALPSELPVSVSIDLENENDSIARDIIKSSCEKYILDKAADRGIPLHSADVTLDGADSAPLPVAVTVFGAFTKQQRQAFSDEIRDALGIQTENQTWIWE